MKISTSIMILSTVIMVTVSCGPKKTTQNSEAKKEAPQMLVVYYSQLGNTKAVATEIATRLHADMEEITPVIPYEDDFQATVERGKKELDEGNFPEIQPLTADVSNYDVIFIGFPVWFGTYAPPIATFLSQVDLSGKKIVPFCTFGSGGLESSKKELAEAEAKAKAMGLDLSPYDPVAEAKAKELAAANARKQAEEEQKSKAKAEQREKIAQFLR